MYFTGHVDRRFRLVLLFPKLSSHVAGKREYLAGPVKAAAILSILSPCIYQSI